jgi:5-methylcytosine-specific restriction endonuclease McrA
MPCLRCGRLSPESYCPEHRPSGWRSRPSPSSLDRVPTSVRRKVRERDGDRCRLCGCPRSGAVKLAVDHVLPVSRGGTHDVTNLVTLCERCYWAKTRAEAKRRRRTSAR